MRIADISIKQPVFITMIILALVVVGVLSYSRLGVDLMPDITLPIVAVTIANPGVGPEEMESQVTKPIEDALSTINGLDKLSSTSAEGISVIVASFVLEKDSQVASTEVREKVATIRNTLPREIIEPVINKFDPSASPIVSFSILSRGGKMSLSEVRSYLDDRIKPQIQQVEGVGAVDLIGGLEREIQVEVNLDRMNAQGISVAQITQAIRGENLNLPAGRVTEKSQDFLLRTKAEFASLPEMLDIVVANVAGNPVHLKEIAAVKDGFKTKRTISRINGRECVSLVVQKQSGTNTVKVADQVNKMMIGVEKANPDLEVHVATDSSVQIKDSRDDVINSLVLGVLFAGIVVLFSFGDLRNTLITIAGLPVCLIAAFGVMGLFGYTVNMITLLALSLSVGLLIDDAIVVRENIFRHMEKLGQDPMKAASEGTSEVGLAVTATTMTIVAVFLPVAFTTGIAGKFFRQFGVTVAAAVLISLFEAFTFAPMLSAYFFKKSERGGRRTLSMRFQDMVTRFYESLGGNYRPVLRWALKHRKSMVALTTVVFILSAYLFTVVGTGGTPHGERAEFNLVIQTASGSSLDQTDAIIRGIEAKLRQQPEIKDIATVVGSTDGSSDVATVNVKLNLTTKASRGYEDILRPKLMGIPGATITFQEASSMGGAAFASMQQLPIQINLKGTELAALSRASDMVLAALRGIGGLVDVNSDNRPPKPELRILAPRDGHGPDRGRDALDRGRRHRLEVPGRGEALRHPGPGDGGPPVQPRAAEPGLPADHAGRNHHPRPGRRAADGQRPDPDQALRPDAADHDRGQHPQGAAPQRDHPEGQCRPGRSGPSARRDLPVRRTGGAEPEDVRLARTGPGPGHRLRLHGPGVPVRFVHPALRPDARPAAVHHRGRSRAASGGQALRHGGLHRPDHAHGARDEELHPAHRLYQSAQAQGDEAVRSHHGRRGDAAPADPHDLAGHDPGHDPGRSRLRHELGLPGGDRLHDHRRPDQLDDPDPGRRPGRLLDPGRRRPEGDGQEKIRRLG
jgi:multidrug efflux pump subunit AcrB